MPPKEFYRKQDRKKTVHSAFGSSPQERAKLIFRDAKALRDNLDPGEGNITDEEIKDYLKKDDVINKYLRDNPSLSLDDVLFAPDPP